MWWGQPKGHPVQGVTLRPSVWSRSDVPHVVPKPPAGLRTVRARGMTSCSIPGPDAFSDPNRIWMCSLVFTFKGVSLFELHTRRPQFFATCFDLSWCFETPEPQRGLPGHPLPSSGTHSTARAFPRLIASLPIGQVGRLGPRGLQSPCPPGHGRPVRAAPLSCEKGRGPSDKALGPPHATATATATAGRSLPSSPSPALPQAGVQHGMNFTTRCLWFHYESPHPGQHPQPRGPPLHLSGQEASFPTQAAAGGSLGSPWEDFPVSQMTPVVPGESGAWSQEACPALPNTPRTGSSKGVD